MTSVHRIIDPRIERKLGKRVLALMMEIRSVPQGDIKRFVVVKRKLARAVADYTKYTGRDTLDPNVDYGYHI